MIKVILIDDEPLAREIIKAYLKHFDDIEVVQECNDGFEGVKAIMQHQPDLIFLDVQMPGMTGFDVLDEIAHVPYVIFTTAYDHYAIKAFEKNAVDYLLKPLDQERFKLAVERA